MAAKKTSPTKTKASPAAAPDGAEHAKTTAGGTSEAASAEHRAAAENKMTGVRASAPGARKPGSSTAARATVKSATRQKPPVATALTEPARPANAAELQKKPTPTVRSKQPAKRRRKPTSGDDARTALYGVGAIVRHRFYPFRGIVFDIDPQFNNTEEWWQSIPLELRPDKNQPFYHLLAENAETEYIAYVSEQNLLPDRSGQPLRHPRVAEMFFQDENGRFYPVFIQTH